MANKDAEPFRPLEPPGESWKDYAHEAGVAGFNALTFGVGGTYLAMIVGSPLSRRRQEFEREISERIQELERQGRVTSEQLSQHEQFISTYVEATLAAVRTHEHEKREALRNAVLNSALDDSPDQSIQQTFVSLVAEFSPWHLRLLRFFQDPKSAFVAAGKPSPKIHVTGNLALELPKLYPELTPREEFVELILSDLNSKQLASVPRYRLQGGDETVFAKRTTKLGDHFLGFIADPAE